MVYYLITCHFVEFFIFLKFGVRRFVPETIVMFLLVYSMYVMFFSSVFIHVAQLSLC